MIQWTKAAPGHDASDTFLGLDRKTARGMYGYETYMARYGSCKDGPKLKEHEKEFDDWKAAVNFGSAQPDIFLCCPEDRRCDMVH
jgi:hypothetical protein